jgi:hypothetical protein
MWIYYVLVSMFFSFVVQTASRGQEKFLRKPSWFKVTVIVKGKEVEKDDYDISFLAAIPEGSAFGVVVYLLSLIPENSLGEWWPIVNIVVTIIGTIIVMYLEKVLDKMAVDPQLVEAEKEAEKIQLKRTESTQIQVDRSPMKTE